MSFFSTHKLNTLIDQLQEQTGRKWTIREIAKETDISPGYLNLLKNNKRNNPSTEVIHKLSKFFNVPPEHFFDVEQTPPFAREPETAVLVSSQVQQTISLCEQLIQNNNPRQAMELLSILMQQPDVVNQRKLQAKLYHLQASAHIALGQYEEALAILAPFLQPDTPPYERSQALYSRARLAYQKEKYSEAIADLTLASDLMQTVETDDRDLDFKIRYMLGICTKETGEYGASLYHLETAARLFPENQSPLTRAHLYMGLGNTQLRLQNYESARRMFTQAEEIYQQEGAAKYLADIRHNLARLYLITNDVPQAVAQFQSCLQAHQETGDHLGIAHDLLELANCYRELGEWKQVADMALRSMITFENGNLIGQAAKAKLLLIEARVSLEEDIAAQVPLLDEVIATFETIHWSLDLARTLHLKANVLRLLGQSEGALELSMRAFDLYQAHSRNFEFLPFD